MGRKKSSKWRKFIWGAVAIFAVALLALQVGVWSSLEALLLGINSANINPQTAKDIKNLSAGIVRLDAFSWDLIERHQGTFDFSATDAMVKEAEKNDLTILGLLQYSPSWASGTGVSMPEDFASYCGLPNPTKASYDKYRAYPPGDPADFANFVYATVKHYPEIKYWQIWNEPNNPVFWKGAPNAAEYTELLKQAYQAAKEANPDSVIVSGGLSLNDLNYLGEMYSAGAKNYFDIMAVHPYNLTQEPSEYLENEMNRLKGFMNANGDGNKSIWITEIGWPTTKGGLTEEAQAKYVEQTYVIADGLNYIGAVFWNTLSDCTGAIDRNSDEQNFGLYRSDLSEKPAVKTYRELIYKH